MGVLLRLRARACTPSIARERESERQKEKERESERKEERERAREREKGKERGGEGGGECVCERESVCCVLMRLRERACTPCTSSERGS